MTHNALIALFIALTGGAHDYVPVLVLFLGSCADCGWHRLMFRLQ